MKYLYLCSQKEKEKYRDRVDMIIDIDRFVLTDGTKGGVIDLRDYELKRMCEKEYLSFIAACGMENNSHFWWATRLSEKDDLTSPLFGRIGKLVCINNTIEDKVKPCKSIMIVTDDPILSVQINKNYKRKWCVKNYICNKWQYIGKTTVMKVRSFLNEARFIMQTFAQKKYFCKILPEHFQKNSEVLYTVIRTTLDARTYSSGIFHDSYFKVLPEYFKKANKTILYFVDIISDSFKEIVSHIREDKGGRIIPLFHFLNWYDFFYCWYLSIFKKPQINFKRAFVYSQSIDLLIKDECAMDAYLMHFIRGIYNYLCCRRLIEQVNVERFIYTFENYAWEKMTVLAIKEKSPQTNSIGFQHAFISRNSFKYFPWGDEKQRMPSPDVILTMGQKTKDILGKYGNYPDDLLHVGCALRQDTIYNLKPLSRQKTRNIFVPLSITIEDTVKVMTLLYEAGMAQYDGTLCFRFHPLTPRAAVFAQLPFEFPNNFIISSGKETIYEELRNIAVVLYTCTTVCLEALKLGRPVIYLDVNYPYDVDPLFECNYLKDSCSSPQDLLDKIKHLRVLSDEDYHNEYRHAAEYLDKYFYPVNEENVKQFYEYNKNREYHKVSN